MKKRLSIFLACLLLAASFAAAEDLKPVTLNENPLKLESCLNEAGTKYIITGQGNPDSKIRVKITNYAALSEAGGMEAEHTTLDVYSGGNWQWELPVRDDEGVDKLDGYGDIASVFVWAQYIVGNEAITDYEYVGELIRMDAAVPEATQPPVIAMSSEADGGAELYGEPSYETVVQKIIYSIRYISSQEPYANKQVTLKVEGKNVYVTGTTDEFGKVSFETKPEMQEPGTLMVILDENGREISRVTSPTSEETNQQLQSSQTYSPQQSTVPGGRMDQIEVIGGDAAADKGDGFILKGIPDAVVYILCALFLAGYAVCWLGLKFPEKFGGKRKGV